MSEPLNEPATGLSWEQFATQLTRQCPSLKPPAPDDRIAESCPDVMTRTIVRLVIAKLGRGLPKDLVSTIETFGEAHTWCAEKWVGEQFPEDVSDGPLRPDNAASGVRLRPVESQDVPELYRAAVNPESGFRWRNRGTTPNPRRFADQLYEGTLAQFVVCRRSDDALCGYVACYNARMDNQTAYIAFARVGNEEPRGELFEGMFHLVEYVFRTWNFRKLYAEMPAYNEYLVSGLTDDLLKLEGRLVGNEYHDGEWSDLLILALWRDDWEPFAQTWRKYLTNAF